LLEPAGLCDVWVELYHGGDYTVDEGETPVLQERLDRILYKSGDGVTITPSSLENIEYKDKDGKTCTDHLAVGATLAVTFDNPPQTTDAMNSESIDFLMEGKRRVEVIFSTLLLLLKSIPELF
jgi:hypothetical protein